MEKYLFLGVAFALAACGGRNQNAGNEWVDDEPVVEEITDYVPVEVDTIALRQKAVKQLKSWGARGASIDEDGYLVYEVYSSDISGSGDEVAHAMYQAFMDVPISGVRVVNHATKTELGRYDE